MRLAFCRPAKFHLQVIASKLCKFAASGAYCASLSCIFKAHFRTMLKIFVKLTQTNGQNALLRFFVTYIPLQKCRVRNFSFWAQKKQPMAFAGLLLPLSRHICGCDMPFLQEMRLVTSCRQTRSRRILRARAFLLQASLPTHPCRDCLYPP